MLARKSHYSIHLVIFLMILLSSLVRVHVLIDFYNLDIGERPWCGVWNNVSVQQLFVELFASIGIMLFLILKFRNAQLLIKDVQLPFYEADSRDGCLVVDEF